MTRFDPAEAMRLADLTHFHPRYDLCSDCSYIADKVQRMADSLKAAVASNAMCTSTHRTDQETIERLRQRVRLLETEVTKLRTTWEPPRDDEV